MGAAYVARGVLSSPNQVRVHHIHLFAPLLICWGRLRRYRKVDQIFARHFVSLDPDLVVEPKPSWVA
jgi:hypothetical protein